MQSKIEQKRMKDEARAIENKKREEAKADQVVRNAEVSLDAYFSVVCSSWYFVKKSVTIVTTTDGDLPST